MDCAITSGLLIPYHLGTVTEDERAAVDEHLVSCSSCLRAYFAVKHQMDRGANALRPSPALRARLARSVEREFRPGGARRALRFLERPIPLYQGALGAAVALAIAALVPVVVRLSVEPPRAPIASERVDTSRPGPSSVNVY